MVGAAVVPGAAVVSSVESPQAAAIIANARSSAPNTTGRRCHSRFKVCLLIDLPRFPSQVLERAPLGVDLSPHQRQNDGGNSEQHPGSNGDAVEVLLDHS